MWLVLCPVAVPSQALTKFIKKNAKKSFELPKKSKKDKEDDKDEDDKEVKDEL
jgi:hypothetical protein